MNVKIWSHGKTKQKHVKLNRLRCIECYAIVHHIFNKLLLLAMKEEATSLYAAKWPRGRYSEVLISGSLLYKLFLLSVSGTFVAPQVVYYNGSDVLSVRLSVGIKVAELLIGFLRDAILRSFTTIC